MAPPSDADLLRAIARGEEDALQALHTRYLRPVHGFCLRLVRDPAVAEEVAADVFFQAWRGAARFEGRSKPSTWLFGIAYHLAMNRVRGRRPPTVELDELAPLAGDDPTPADAAESGEAAARLHRALGALTPDHRAVLELTYAQGLSCGEAAEALGVPVNTVKTRMFYARQRLRELLPRLGVRGDAA